MRSESILVLVHASASGTAFVGRVRELALLIGSRSDAGGITLVTGDAGSGKTRLLAEAADRAGAEGVLVLRGHGVPDGGAFRPFAEALIRVAPSELANDERLAPYRSVLAWILPGWPAATASKCSSGGSGRRAGRGRP
jgi:hypothetical protein